jgi:hypothetical protein
MVEKIGQKELRLRELAQQTRRAKNVRAKAVPDLSVLYELREKVAKVSPKKPKKKHAKKKWTRR